MFPNHQAIRQPARATFTTSPDSPTSAAALWDSWTLWIVLRAWWPQSGQKSAEKRSLKSLDFSSLWAPKTLSGNWNVLFCCWVPMMIFSWRRGKLILPAPWSRNPFSPASCRQALTETLPAVSVHAGLTVKKPNNNTTFMLHRLALAETVIVCLWFSCLGA